MKILMVLLVPNFLLFGCGKDKEDFPASLPDMQYGNGHTLVKNESDPAVLAWEAELIDLTNQVRAKNGLPPLGPNMALSAVARGHSVHQSEHNFYAHQSPEGLSPYDRLELATGLITFSPMENVCKMSLVLGPKAALDAFIGSPSHRGAILSEGHLIGVGIYDTYVTMEIVRAY